MDNQNCYDFRASIHTHAHAFWKQQVSLTGLCAGHSRAAYHNRAVLWTAGNDLIVMWAPVYVEHRSCVATHCRVGFVNATSLKEERNKLSMSHQCHRVGLFSQTHFSLITSTQNSPRFTSDNIHISQCQLVRTVNFHFSKQLLLTTLHQIKNPNF